MERDVLGHYRLPIRYEESTAIDAALEAIPLEKIYGDAEALEEQDQHGENGFGDYLVMALLKWFKQWFKWVNNASCRQCDGETERRDTRQASPEEQKYGAGNTEVFWCSKCNIETVFPRYNDPVKLLETRQGRCGEWANVMTLLLRALDLRVRYIWNAEDHVWNEVYSEHHQRWIHVDSCEEAFDKPLIYADGWGKKMSYVLAYSVDGSSDVTRRYVRREDAALPRTRCSEQKLQAMLQSCTMELRTSKPPQEQADLFDQDQLEAAELASYIDTKKTVEQPRQSGAPGWVSARGEGGQ